jgi:hypothetical protein
MRLHGKVTKATGILPKIMAWAHTWRSQRTPPWDGHDASVWRQIDTTACGFYGFSKADEKTALLSEKIPSNATNIRIPHEAFHSLESYHSK